MRLPLELTLRTLEADVVPFIVRSQKFDENDLLALSVNNSYICSSSSGLMISNPIAYEEARNILS